MRRFLLTVAAAATTLVGTACGDTTGLGSDVAGTYELRTLNGQTLPASDQSGSFIFVGGELELDNDGSFVDIVYYRTPSNSSIQPAESFGTWERSGNRIRLDYEGGAELFADRTSTNRLVLEDTDGNEWAYQRF